MLVAFLRHGETGWNLARRLQGQSDQPILPTTAARLQGLRLPPPFETARAFVSPLSRARQTADSLGLSGYRIEPRLIEMKYGEFEGRAIADLRLELGDGMRRNEGRGLDFHPPQGESPREVQHRLADWLREIAADPAPALAITHKGVMRCMLTLAYGWDMTGRQPVKLDWTALHVFELDRAGHAKPHALNLPLMPR